MPESASRSWPLASSATAALPRGGAGVVDGRPRAARSGGVKVIVIASVQVVRGDVVGRRARRARRTGRRSGRPSAATSNASSSTTGGHTSGLSSPRARRSASVSDHSASASSCGRQQYWWPSGSSRVAHLGCSPAFGAESVSGVGRSTGSAVLPFRSREPGEVGDDELVADVELPGRAAGDPLEVALRLVDGRRAARSTGRRS